MDKEQKPSPVGSAVNESIRPDFLRGGSSREDAGSSAAEDLGAAEKAASNGGLLEKKDNGLDEAKETEKSGGFFTGSGKGDDKGKKKKGKFKGGFKKRGPIIAIFMAIFGFSGSMMWMQSFQLFAWVENVNLNFGQSSAVLNRRTNFVLKRAFSGNPNNTEITRTDIFGREKYKIGTKMASKLKANNIDVVETTGTDGKPLKMLVWTDSDGAKIPIVASDSDVSRIPSGFDTDTGTVKLSAGLTLDSAKTTIDGFRVDLDTSTITLTGKIAGWFDSLADAFLKRIGGDDVRNKLKSLTGDSDSDDIDDLMYKNGSGGVDDTDTSAVRIEQEGEDGKLETRPVKESDYTDRGDGGNNGGGDDGNNSLKPGEVDTPKVESKLKMAVRKAAVGGSIACMALKGIGAINAVVAGAQVANVVNYTLKILEAADKVRAGEGNDSFNQIANSLNEPTESTFRMNGEEVTLVGSTTESDGWNNVFSDKNIVSENDPGALMVNREFATKNALQNTNLASLEGFSDLAQAAGNFGNSVKAFSLCNGIQAALGIADFVGDIALFISTGGVGKFVKEFVKGIYEGAKVTLAISALSMAISMLAPVVGQWLAGNLKNIFLGKVGGYALESGAHIVHDGNLQMSAGMNMNKEQTVELYAMTREVEKEWAAYDRSTLSPFDITSKYTFMGSLVRSAIPLLNSTSGSVVSSITSSMDLLGKSIATLSGDNVSALNDVGTFGLSLSSDENCANLSSMGLAGDAYCNRYSGAYIDDLSTKTSYELYEKISDSFDGVDSYGNPQIKDNSDYAKYIIACNTNDAQPGTMSAVVEGYIQKVNNALSGGTAVGSTLVGFATNFIPGEGLLDALDAGEQQKRVKWNSQAVCSDPDYRYYSDYSVDQRVLEGLGIVEKSSVTAFLDRYYEENPLDNSYEGVIARYSGLSKEEVIDTIALIEYIDYVTNYDASERYAFGEPAVKDDGKMDFSNENKLAEAPLILLNEISFADVRNRSFAV